jgi:hypothetical protein
MRRTTLTLTCMTFLGLAPLEIFLIVQERCGAVRPKLRPPRRLTSFRGCCRLSPVSIGKVTNIQTPQRPRLSLPAAMTLPTSDYTDINGSSVNTLKIIDNYENLPRSHLHHVTHGTHARWHFRPQLHWLHRADCEGDSGAFGGDRPSGPHTLTLAPPHCVRGSLPPLSTAADHLRSKFRLLIRELHRLRCPRCQLAEGA